MRSYEYNAGIWTLISDPLPREADKKHDPNQPSRLDPDFRQISAQFKNQEQAYIQARDALGFTEKRTLKCSFGDVEVYVRNHVDLPAKRLQKEFKYDFMCVLRFASSYIRAWVIDLPNFLLFLREIEAHEIASEPRNEIAEVLGKFFFDEDVQSLIMWTKWLVEHIDDGQLEVAIKQAQPKKK